MKNSKNQLQPFLKTGDFIKSDDFTIGQHPYLDNLSRVNYDVIEILTSRAHLRKGNVDIEGGTFDLENAHVIDKKRSEYVYQVLVTDNKEKVVESPRGGQELLRGQRVVAVKGKINEKGEWVESEEYIVFYHGEYYDKSITVSFEFIGRDTESDPVPVDYSYYERLQ